MDERIKEYITKGVDSLRRIDGEKDFQKQLQEDVKETFDMKAADFNARVKVAYDLVEATNKRDKMTDVIDEIDALGF